MMLTISLRNLAEDKNVTVTVDEEQKIEGTLKILSEAGIINGMECQTVRSMRNKNRIHVEQTYKESHIYNGDILVFE